MFTINVSPGVPQQRFVTDLEGEDHELTFRWNTRTEVWTLDIEKVDGTPVIYGLALVQGGDILWPYNLGIGGLFLYDTDGTFTDAGLDDLGDRVLLILATEDELANGVAI